MIVYMYPAMALYKHYKASGEMQEAENMLSFAKKISEMLGDPDHYKRFLEEKSK